MTIDLPDVALWCGVREDDARRYLDGGRDLPSDVLERIERGLETLMEVEVSRDVEPVFS